MTEGVHVKGQPFERKTALVDLKDVSYDDKVRVIGLVQMNRCVWDPTHEKYLCASTKKIVWGNIATQLSTSTSRFTDKTVYHIWRNLSDTLKKKITRLRLKMAESESMDWDTVLSGWKYYDHMTFMIEVLDSAIFHQMQANASKMVFDSSIISEESTSRQMLEESDSWPPQTPPPQKRSRLRAGDRDDIKQESMTHPDTTDEFPMPNVTNYLMDNPPNPVIAQATGDTVAEMYRNLEQCNMRVQAAKFRKEINDIVYKYELEIAEAMNQR